MESTVELEELLTALGPGGGGATAVRSRPEPDAPRRSGPAPTRAKGPANGGPGDPRREVPDERPTGALEQQPAETPKERPAGQTDGASNAGSAHPAVPVVVGATTPVAEAWAAAGSRKVGECKLKYEPASLLRRTG